MNFLRALRSDLFSRPLLPLVILACAGLIGAIVYVASSGGSSPVGETAPPVRSPVGASHSVLNAVSEAPANPNQATSETTSGAGYQNQGKAHNPFKLLPAPPAPKAQGNSKSSSSSSTSGSSPSKSSPTNTKSAGGTVPSSSTPAPKVSKPKPPQAFYTVNVELGPPPTVPGEAPKLTPYKNLKVNDAVPSKKNSLIVLKSASLDAKALAGGTLNGNATFELVSAPIVKGPGICLPSATQCESVKLALGQVEELQVLEPNGQNVTYLLRLTFIFKHLGTASSARANSSKSHAAHKAARHRR